MQIKHFNLEASLVMLRAATIKSEKLLTLLQNLMNSK